MFAQKLLSFSDQELYEFWVKHIACSYWHGLYLANASERSKKWCFSRWKKGLAKEANQ